VSSNLTPSYKPNKNIQLTETEIKWICIKAKGILMQQPVFLELDSPINICGKKIF
jgi:serine/threonine-protein phosphatase PP1 catalytic subunit